MARVQETKARDEGASREEARVQGKAAADRAAARARGTTPQAQDGTRLELATLEAMSDMELVQLMVERGVAFTDCTKRDELVQRAYAKLGEPVARHHAAYQAHHRPAGSHLRGSRVDRSAVEKRDWLDN
eukprot:CAMPEP_0115865684 /NCGR_PEP_ID=MMETSP0287-20121206/19850_1 /TAXON_ID=412157 /ORGANISM="Chrysochromulina rotalis, Strain UIO044" /LENGTH=128 /DNA_ID=CAMNT_0003320207 /DNA_START=80 /DNA_END=466 /DNA_ORIENTATION=-